MHRYYCHDFAVLMFSTQITVLMLPSHFTVLRLRPVLFSPGDYICRKGSQTHLFYPEHKVRTTRSELSSNCGENTLFSSLFLLFYFVRNLPHILSEERNYGHCFCQTNIYYYIEKLKMYADSKNLNLH